MIDGAESLMTADTRSSCWPIIGTDKGTAMMPASSEARKADDVVEALRSQYRRPDHPAIRMTQQFVGDYLCTLVRTCRPRQGLGKPRGINLVVNERVRARIRVLPGLFAQHGGYRRFHC